MEKKANNFLIKFIQTVSFAVVLALLIALCSVLPGSNTGENPGELPVPVTAESGSNGLIDEKIEYSEDNPDSERPVDTITGAITQPDVPNTGINDRAPVPERTAEAPIPAPASTPAPAPAKTVASVNNQDKPVTVPNNSDPIIDDYTQEIQINPNNAAAYHSRGFAYYIKGDYDRAIADFTQAIKIDPKNAVTHNNRGAAYNSKGNYDLAITDLDQAIRLNPDFENPYRHRAFACFKKGNYKQARADVNKALQINPSNLSAQDLSAELKRLGY